MIRLADVDAVCRHLLRDGAVKLAHRIRHEAAEWEHVCSLNPSKPGPTVVPFRAAASEERALDEALREARARWAA
jgi:hypothetical protein